MKTDREFQVPSSRFQVGFGFLLEADFSNVGTNRGRKNL
jgi:hypothetical protein